MIGDDQTGFVHIADAAEKVVENALNRLGPKREHGRKETGRDGATNTDPALTETTYDGGS